MSGQQWLVVVGFGVRVSEQLGEFGSRLDERQLDLQLGGFDTLD